MTPERYRRINNLFTKAADMDSAQRESFLQEECGDDSELLREVRDLLEQALQQVGAAAAGVELTQRGGQLACGPRLPGATHRGAT